MRLTIKGLWKYKDLAEEHDKLRADSVIQSTALASGKKELAYTRARLEEEMQSCRDLEEKLEEARAEIGQLKKVRYQWLESMHGWWPVEGTDIDDLAQKVPYVVYVPKPMEKKVPES